MKNPDVSSSNFSDIKSTSRTATSVAFVVSVAVHVVLFLFVGTVVIFEATTPPSFFNSIGGGVLAESGQDELEAPPLLEDEIQQPDSDLSSMEEPVMATDMGMVDTLSTQDLIVATTSNPNAMPQFYQPALSTGSALGTPSTSGLKGTTSSGQGKAGTPRVANIFGRTVTSSRFGAILDISNSTHRTIDVAINEINNGFPEALLMLAPGCGMDPSQKGEVIEGTQFTNNLQDYFYQGKNKEQITNHDVSAGFLNRLLGKEKGQAGNKNFVKLWERAIREGRGFVIQIDMGEIGTGTRILKIHGTQYGFNYLMDQGCDVIYWMADFDDSINEALAKQLTNRLKRSGVKVILHDFNGGDQLTKKGDAKAKNLSQFATETGGEIIIGSGK